MWDSIAMGIPYFAFGVFLLCLSQHAGCWKSRHSWDSAIPQASHMERGRESNKYVINMNMKCAAAKSSSQPGQLGAGFIKGSEEWVDLAYGKYLAMFVDWMHGHVNAIQKQFYQLENWGGHPEKMAYSSTSGENMWFPNQSISLSFVIIFLAVSELELAILECMGFKVNNMTTVKRVPFPQPRSWATDGLWGVHRKVNDRTSLQESHGQMRGSLTWKPRALGGPHKAFLPYPAIPYPASMEGDKDQEGRAFAATNSTEPHWCRAFYSIPRAPSIHHPFI